jgi:hypothetical protein
LAGSAGRAGAGVSGREASAGFSTASSSGSTGADVGMGGNSSCRSAANWDLTRFGRPAVVSRRLFASAMINILLERSSAQRDGEPVEPCLGFGPVCGWREEAEWPRQKDFPLPVRAADIHVKDRCEHGFRNSILKQTRKRSF